MTRSIPNGNQHRTPVRGRLAFAKRLLPQCFCRIKKRGFSRGKNFECLNSHINSTELCRECHVACCYVVRASFQLSRHQRKVPRIPDGKKYQIITPENPIASVMPNPALSSPRARINPMLLYINCVSKFPSPPNSHSPNAQRAPHHCPSTRIRSPWKVGLYIMYDHFRYLFRLRRLNRKSPGVSS